MNIISKACLCAVAMVVGSSTMINAQEVAISHIAQPATPSLNIRYVDMDEITANYTMAIEYQQWATLTSDSIKAVLTKKYNVAKDFEAACQKKLNNNKYASRPAYEKDLKKLQTMVEDAQKLEESLTKEYQRESAARMQVLQDSIMNYIVEYNVTRKYDAILYKAAGVLFNPALDITKEIIVGLNKRYSKPVEIEALLPDEGLVPQKEEDNTITP